VRHAWFGIDVMIPILTLLAAALVASDTGGTATFIGTREKKSPAKTEQAAEIDRNAERSLAAGKTDARRWLDQSNKNHLVWKWNKTAALDAVNELHRAGATDVWVASVTNIDRGADELTSHFIVAMPTDAFARTRVFAWIARWEEDAGINPEAHTTDVGQRYVVINTDQ